MRDVRIKLSGGLVPGYIEVTVTIDLQSTYKGEMDVRRLVDKGFFTVFSSFSPQYTGVFWFRLPQ